MSHINKITSCRTILAKIARTFKPSGSSWRREAIEDIGWAIQGIGYHCGFEHKSTEPPYIVVKNNRGKIPCDVERIKHVEQLLPDNSNDNILNPDGTTPTEEEIVNTCKYKGVKMRKAHDTSMYGVSEANPRTTEVVSAVPYYSLNGDYVITEFSDGLIKLHYVGFHVDKDGFPMVLDDFDYKTAIEWYCFQNMILKGYKHPELSFKDAFQMWEMYRLRAENAPKVPSLDAAESFKWGWNRFINGYEFGRDFYMNLEQPEFTS
jgi:hypothetical protein